MDYLRNPKDIYQQSFATIKSEADLAQFSPDEQEVAIRLIHSCGMVDIADNLVFSDAAVVAGRSALAQSAPIITDVQMVAKGIIERNLLHENKIICGLDMVGAREFALEQNTTRSAAGIEMLADKIAGAIIVIGNAPTALFHLLEMIEKGQVKPALILGFPVGFVGAVESKQALIESVFELPYITLTGRRGGSAMAAAALNAVAVGLAT